MSEKGEPVDIVALADELEHSQSLEEVGGRAYLVNLPSVVPTAINVRCHSLIVRKKDILRALISVTKGNCQP